MATYCYFPSCVSVSSRNLSLTHHHQLLQPRRDQHPPLPHFLIRASASKKSRRSRKLKSDAELCNDIRDFVAAAGLPENHIPTTKELMQYGRNDLANIVRRRGYKLLRELMTSSLSSNLEVFGIDKSLDEKLDGSDDSKDLLTGQNLKVDTASDHIAVSKIVSSGNNYSCLNNESISNTDDHSCISIESSATSPKEELDLSDEVNYAAEGYCYSTEASIDDGHSSPRKGPDANFDNQSSIAAETTGRSSVEERSSENLEIDDYMMSKMVGEITLLSTVPSTENQSNTSLADSDLDTQDWSKLEDPDHSSNDIAGKLSSSTEISIMEDVSGGKNSDSIGHSTDNSCINMNSSAHLSLEEKVANFIQSGVLDPVEGHAFGILNGNESEEREVHIESGSAVEIMSNAEHSKHPPEDDTPMALSESSLTSKQVVPTATINRLSWDHHLQDEDETARFDKDLDAEAAKTQNQSDIKHLKIMLYQKELELSQLKEQIEKEKLALSVLQTKAEEEINKARKLVTEKDAELHVAEESLSGLKEVQIEFCGDGDSVEVAGCFNGWHHRIKMDPQSSKNVIDPTASRRSRLWSTVLWLYPGVYEIKFVVDGHWRIDPQRETITKGHICNNILRVDQ